MGALFRIRWYNAQTGTYGQGTAALDWDGLQEWLHWLNRNHPDMWHWWVLA